MTSIAAHWQFWALLSALFAALTAIFGKVGVQGINPDWATLIRTLVILSFVVAVVVVTRVERPTGDVTSKTYSFLVLSGLATGASWLCYFRALTVGSASQVAPVDKLSVVFVALLGVFVLGESLSLWGWLGVALVAAGSILLASTS